MPRRATIRGKPEHIGPNEAEPNEVLIVADPGECPCFKAGDVVCHIAGLYGLLRTKVRRYRDSHSNADELVANHVKLRRLRQGEKVTVRRTEEPDDAEGNED